MINFIKIFLLSHIILLTVFNTSSVSQTYERLPDTVDLDKLFLVSRELAFNGQRDSARMICRQILEVKPNYYDVQVLMGRTYAWDKKYDSARIELKDVLKKKKNYHDAIDALIDVEKWSHNPDSGNYYCNYGLRFYPNDEHYLIQKANFLIMQENFKEAQFIIMQVLEINPTNQKALELLKKVKTLGLRNKIIMEYNFEYFEKPYIRRWHIYSFEYVRKTPIGSFIGRFNVGDLVKDGEQIFDNVGLQFEIDAYPKLFKKSYAYLNYGYSLNKLFPRHRVGFELYQMFYKKFEISLGTRFLQFRKSDGSNTNVVITTGAIGMYHKNYWVSFRPYITPKTYGVSQSFNFEVRRYFKSANNYISIFTGTGNSPDEPSNIGEFDIYKLKSSKVRLSYQRSFFSRLLVKGIVGYKNEEYNKSKHRNNLKIEIRISCLL